MLTPPLDLWTEAPPKPGAPAVPGFSRPGSRRHAPSGEHNNLGFVQLLEQPLRVGEIAQMMHLDFEWERQLELVHRPIESNQVFTPQLISGYSSSGYAQGLAVSANHVFVADGPAGLLVIEISNPAQPQQVGRQRGQTVEKLI